MNAGASTAEVRPRVESRACEGQKLPFLDAKSEWGVIRMIPNRVADTDPALPNRTRGYGKSARVARRRERAQSRERMRDGAPTRRMHRCNEGSERGCNGRKFRAEDSERRVEYSVVKELTRAVQQPEPSAVKKSPEGDETRARESPARLDYNLLRTLTIVNIRAEFKGRILRLRDGRSGAESISRGNVQLPGLRNW
jgi:hypothetical protein